MLKYKKDRFCNNDEYSRTKTMLLILSSCCLFGCTAGYYNNGDAGRIETPQSLAVVGPILTETSTETPNEPQADEDQVDKGLVDKRPADKVGAEKVESIQSPAVIVAQDLNNKRPKDASKKASIKLSSKPSIKKPPKKEKIAKQSPSRKIQKQAPAPVSNKPKKIDGGNIDGRVVIVGDNNKLLPPKGIFLTLTPSDGRILDRKERKPMTHTIDMQDKTYLPGYISIRKNDRVSFVNKDKIKHNVFSSTGKNAFDLGTYSEGKMREVSLNAGGIVKVYCNIHADMATFISVSDNNISVVADHQGHFKIDDVEPGEYNLNVWHVRGEKTEKIVVKSRQTNKYITNLNTANYKKSAHKNKFGKQYNKNSAIFDDEFY